MSIPAELEVIARRYRSALGHAEPGELTEFTLSPYDRTGIPVWASVWDDGAGDAHGVGYGTTEFQARVGALGELAERVLLRPVLRGLPTRRNSYSQLLAELGPAAVSDPVSLIMDAGADYGQDRPLWWVPARRWRTGEEVWVPAEFAAFDPASLPVPAGAAPDRLITPVTNGLGAGDTVQRAVAHGLLELLQRDATNLMFRAVDQGVVVKVDASRQPDVRFALDALRRADIEPIVKLAGTEFVCVTYCVGLDENDGTPSIALGAIGEAAHPDRDVAVAKALLEYASSRARRIFAFGSLDEVARHNPDYLRAELARPLGIQEPRALREMTAWTRLPADEMRSVLRPVFYRGRSVELASIPTRPVGDSAQLLATLLQLLSGMDVLTVTTPESGGMVAAKVLVPGLEVETLSYLRIGERGLRLLLDRSSELVGLGSPNRPGALPIRLTAAAAERIGAPAWIDSDAVSATVAGLYPLYREPRRHAVQRSRHR